jgi:hypothetical protein
MIDSDDASARQEERMASPEGLFPAGEAKPDHPERVASWPRLDFVPSGVNASAGFFTWHLETGDVVCDEQTFRLHGLPPDAEPRFETFLRQVPAGDVDRLLHAIDPLLAKVGDYILEYRVRWPDGAMHTLETRGRVVAGPDGRPLRSMGVIADVTERRAAEEAARAEALASARIQQVMTGLAAASTLEEVRAAVCAALPALGADVLFVADAGRPVEVLLACGRGAERMGPFQALDEGPVRTAVALDIPLFFSTRAEMARRFPVAADAVEAAGGEAVAFLPLSGLPRMRGICVLGYARPTVFDETERTVLILAASAIGQAVYRATIHDTEHTIALALQEGMLPRTLKFGPGVRAARRYAAVTTGIQVGGDWYDSVPLDDGSTILIIGDVEGHNVHAAGMMYRLRSTVRAYAAENHPVEEILRRANEYVAEVNEEADQPLFATCLVARVDPATRTVTASRAGHIPPIVAPPGRGARVPHNEVGVPLGIAPDARYPVWRMPYQAGTYLLLCTDGLLESSDNDLDSGIARTLSTLDRMRDAGLDLEELADLVLDVNRPAGGLWKDDVALLLAQLD